MRTNCVGVSWFRSWDEAVEYAEKVTDEHEKKWRIKLLRPLREGEFE